MPKRLGLKQRTGGNMITDNLENVSLYFGLGERMKKGLEYLKSTDFQSMQDGKYEIDGKNLFVVVKTYTTKLRQECRWEAHKEYIDIQYLAQGQELFGYACIQELNEATEYNEADDIYFLDGQGETLLLKPERFLILWPQDAHMPEIAVTNPLPVKKVVVKVKV